MMILRLLPVLVLYVLFLSGCATYKNTELYPESEHTVRADVKSDLPSKWNLPMGVHVNQDTRLIVTGHQGPGFGALFGVVGVVAQDAMQSSKGKKQFTSLSAGLAFDWVAATEEAVQEAISAASNTALQNSDATRRLEITPYGILDTNKNGTSIIYAVLSLEVFDAKESSVWKSRYFMQATDLLRLSEIDEKGLLEIDQNLGKSVHTLIRVLSQQINNQLASGKTVEAQFNLPYVDSKKPIETEMLGIVDECYVFRPKIADILTLSGYHIVPIDFIIEFND